MDDNLIPFPERDPMPDTHEPLEVFTALAAEHGLIRPGDKLDQMVIDFAYAVVERCASVGDAYIDERNDGTAGDHIRSIYGEP